MPFIRVKSKITGHEFDVHPDRLELHPEDWAVVDKKVVDEAREPKHADSKGGVVLPAAPVVSEPEGTEAVVPLKPSN